MAPVKTYTYGHAVPAHVSRHALRLDFVFPYFPSSTFLPLYIKKVCFYIEQYPVHSSKHFTRHPLADL